ncbi:glycosyltransferase family protein [Tessaracoccus caeni]|uniref:glycosyltransferase family protein n=1 Tax=Tessaracoccus caeni TaxID=3031239 RepID=UPI0023DAFF54|nr:glycosyltransferase [Tessaracoccus caeni]MDF1488561.1 glycosyltransferase [Tessaracoccus caeni]
MTTVVMYSHDSVGLGHVRRNRALAFALSEYLPQLTGEPVTGLLIAGNSWAARDTLPPGWDWFILPGMTHGDGGYIPRRLGSPTESVWALRSSTIRAAVEALAPDLFIVDRHPFGIDYELASVLLDARARGCATVLGLREVIDDPVSAAAEWRRLDGSWRLMEAFDEVWLYGDPDVHDARRTGELPPALSRLARPTGYLADGRPQDDGDAPTERPFVLTLVGGGSDGFPLSRIAAGATVPAGHDHLLVAGPQMPGDQVTQLESIAARSENRTRVLRSVPNVPELISRAAAVVSMGGYNTATELMATSTPALMVPRTHRRTEQLIRTTALAEAGAVEWARLEQLTTGSLEEWLAGAVTRRIDRDHLRRDGLAEVPRLAARLLARRRDEAGRELAHVC